jgi:hypothetical protein
VSFQQSNDDQVRPTLIPDLSLPPSLLKTNLRVGTKRKGWAISSRAKKPKTKQPFAGSTKTFPTSQTIKIVFLPLNHMMAWQEEEDNSWATKVRFMSQLS